MATNSIPGKIIGVQIGSDWLQCQAEATLNITGNTTEDQVCKVLDSATPNATPWKTFTLDSREWNITVNQALLKDSFDSANDSVNLAKLMIDDAMEIASVLFRTADSQQFANHDMIYDGAAILTNFSVTGPATGANNTSATFQGNGPLTYSYPPKTT